MNKENIFGMNICTLEYDDFVKAVQEDIKSNRQRSIFAINPEKILLSKNDRELNEKLGKADYLIPDGIGIIIASKLSGGNIKKRLTGVDAMEALCKLAAQNDYKIFLYGAKEGVAEKTKQALETKYNDINIAGCLDGYKYTNEDVIKTINEAVPDIIFVALGSPKQEHWILDNKDKMNVKILQGVGGSFDVLSGQTKRAPLIIRKMGLEWFYRLVKQPKRITRQIKLVKFFFMLLRKDALR